MIDKKPGDSLHEWPSYWDGWQSEPQIDHRPSERISALLGPDGEPLMVPIPRRAMGFDLRQKREG